jgi:hypothetical protein
MESMSGISRNSGCGPRLIHVGDLVDSMSRTLWNQRSRGIHVEDPCGIHVGDLVESMSKTSWNPCRGPCGIHVGDLVE